MTSSTGPSSDFLDLLVGRPGWRLEPRSTPGASPLWCFVLDGKIEYSVTVDDSLIHLYVMETDGELVFKDAGEFTAWLKEHRPEALQEPAARPGKRSRFRDFFEWS